jgi:hypothetical protein
MSTAQPISGLLSTALSFAQQSQPYDPEQAVSQPDSTPPVLPVTSQPSDLWLKHSPLALNTRRAITAIGRALGLEEEKARILLLHSPGGAGKPIFEALATVYALDTAGFGDGVRSPVGMATRLLQGVPFLLNSDAQLELDTLRDNYERFLDGEVVEIEDHRSRYEHNLKRRAAEDERLTQRATERSQLQAKYGPSKAAIPSKPSKTSKKSAETVKVKVLSAEPTTEVVSEAVTENVTETVTEAVKPVKAVQPAKVVELKQRPSPSGAVVGPRHMMLCIDDLVEVKQDGKKLRGLVLSINNGYVEVELKAIGRTISFPAAQVVFVERPEPVKTQPINVLVQALKDKLKVGRSKEVKTMVLSKNLELKATVLTLGAVVQTRKGQMKVIQLEPLQLESTTGTIYNVILE